MVIEFPGARRSAQKSAFLEDNVHPLQLFPVENGPHCFFFFFVVLMRFFPCCLADHDGGAVAVCSVSITVPKTVDQKVVQVNPFDGFAADLWPKGVDGVGPRDRKSLDFCCPVCWCCCHFEAA